MLKQAMLVKWKELVMKNCFILEVDDYEEKML
jgi:hypothetical protein